MLDTENSKNSDKIQKQLSLTTASSDSDHMTIDPLVDFTNAASATRNIAFCQLHDNNSNSGKKNTYKSTRFVKYVNAHDIITHHPCHQSIA